MKNELIISVQDHLKLKWIIQYHELERKISKVRKDWNSFESEAANEYQKWFHQNFPELISEIQELTLECNRYKIITFAVEDQILINSLTRRMALIYVRQKISDNIDPFPSEQEYQKHKDFYFKEDPQIEGDHDFTPSHHSVTDDLPISTENCKKIYRRIVKFLHPDRGTEMNVSESRLWQQAQIAYQAQDLGVLNSILIRIESDGPIEIHLIDSVGEIIDLVQSLQSEWNELMSQKNKFKNSFLNQFWESNLNSKKRDQLRVQVLANLKSQIFNLKKDLNILSKQIKKLEKK